MTLKCLNINLQYPDHISSKVEIPLAAWVAPGTLLNLKALTLNCYARLNSNTFEALVLSTPQLEHFKSFDGRLPCSGLGGLSLTDLRAIGRWRRLRTCYLSLGVHGNDLASPPSWRKFVELRDANFIPGLVTNWKADLNRLELLDVSCRMVTVFNNLPWQSNDTSVYPLVYGRKCDCGRVHFHIDAEGALAKCLGFLKPH